MLMVDRIVEISRDGARGRIVAERDVRLDDWFFQCHFRGDPVQPGCLGVDARLAAARLLLRLGAAGSAPGRALGCGRDRVLRARSARTTRWCATRSTCAASPS